MITITYQKKDKNFLNVTIKGHADFAKFNKDIVCASVSSIVICSVNATLSIDGDALKYEINDGFIKIFDIKYDEVTQKIINNMLNMLKELASQYPKNIIIKE